MIDDLGDMIVPIACALLIGVSIAGILIIIIVMIWG